MGGVGGTEAGAEASHARSRAKPTRWARSSLMAASWSNPVAVAATLC